ncbi:MAG: glycerophosphodiester phosphodiesterase, partial [Bacillota bacterium]
LIGFQKTFQTITKYHIKLLLPIIIFFILLEFGQIALFSSTIKLPSTIAIELEAFNYISIYSLLLFFLFLLFFIETVFIFHDIIIRNSNLKQGYLYSKKTLHKNRFKILLKFIVINVLANLVMLIIYTGLIFLISIFISLLQGQAIVFGLIITSMYSIYWILGLVFSIIIIPLNIALIATHYYNLNNQIVTKPIKIFNESNINWIKKPIIILFIVLFSINILTIIDSIRNANNNVQFLKQEEIIAHRGASYEAPENTLSAIDLAIEQGSEAVEFDVRGTKDHVPVLLHDKTIRRTTNSASDIKITSLNYQNLLQYNAGSWFSSEFANEKIPTLEEALIAIKGKAIGFIDMKTTNPLVEAEIIRLLAENDMITEVKIMSFDINQLYRFKAYNDEIETILLLTSYYGNVSIYFEDENINHFALSINVIKNNPNLINLIHKHNKKAYAWVVDNREAIYLGMEADVDGFITKRPIIAREIAYSKNSKDSFKDFLENLFKP